MFRWADTIYSDKEASQYVWGIGVHWYSGDEFDHLNTTHARWPAKGMLATEATNAGSPIPGSVTSAEKYAHDILGDLNNFVQGWTDWNIVLDAQGGPNHLNNWCDAPVIADTQAGSVSFQPMFYYLGHFSRFLPPGAVRLGNKMQGDSQGLEWATFIVDRKDTRLRSRVSADDDSDSEDAEKLERHGKGDKKKQQRDAAVLGILAIDDTGPLASAEGSPIARTLRMRALHALALHARLFVQPVRLALHTALVKFQ